MTTREKILNTALNLFNQKGVREVSTRMISDTAKISQGNLTYHFAKKDEIVNELYLKLVDEMNLIFSNSAEQTSFTVKDLFEGTRVIYQTLYKYSFCMIDFVQLMRDFPKINEHFKSLMEQRQAQFQGLFAVCVASGIFKEEEFNGHFAKMQLPLSVFGDYWISHSVVLFDGTPEEAIETYARSAMMLLYPLMTEHAKKECLEML